jgi:hypothetical protein
MPSKHRQGQRRRDTCEDKQRNRQADRNAANVAARRRPSCRQPWDEDLELGNRLRCINRTELGFELVQADRAVSHAFPEHRGVPLEVRLSCLAFPH